MSGLLISVNDDGAGGTGGTGDDTFRVSVDLTTGATIDGNAGNDVLVISPGFTENEISDVIIIVEVEEVATGSAAGRISVSQLASFDRIVDYGFMDPTFILTGGGTITATLQVVGLDSLTIEGSSEQDKLNFGSSTDNTFMILEGNDGDDSLISGDGDDSLLGGRGNDTLNGLGGADWIEGGRNDDVITAGTDDTIYGDSDITIGTGNDTIKVIGSLLSGEIWGGGGSDTMELDGTPGITLTLGAGLVVVDMEVLKLENGQALSVASTILTSFDTLTLLGLNGGSDSATITLTGIIDAITLDVTLFETLTVNGVNTPFNAASDLLTFTSAATDITVNGQAGDDVITTGDGDDVLNGGIDDDLLDGMAGLDTLVGGAGNDTLRVRSGDDADGGTEDDTIGIWEDLTFGLTTLDGGDGYDIIDANGAKTLGNGVTLVNIEELRLDASTFTMQVDQLDSLTTIGADGAATQGVLVILGTGFAAGTDVTGLDLLTVTASVGDDVLVFTSAGTEINLAAGNGNDSIVTGNGDDTLSGGKGADTLNGEGGADRLEGGKSRDLLIGGGGNDTLSGQGGNDTLSGGAGLDVFSFVPGGGTDTITDFVDGEDVIRIRNFGTAFDTDAEVLAAAVQAGNDVSIVLANPGGGNTVILIEDLLLAQLSGADIDVF